MKPEDRKRLKQHIEMIVEHREPDEIVRENFKKLQDEVADLREKNIKLRIEAANYLKYSHAYITHQVSTVVKTSTDNNKPSISDVSVTQDVLISIKTGQPVEKETCSWIQEDDPDICYWKTGCGNSFYFTEGTPTDNNMKYCCYCGKLLKQED